MLRRNFLKILGITPIAAKMLTSEVTAVEKSHARGLQSFHSVGFAVDLNKYDYFDDISLFMDAKFDYGDSKTQTILQQRQMLTQSNHNGR